MAIKLTDLFAHFVVLYISTFLGLAFLPNSILPNIEPEEFETKTPPLEGPFEPNNELDKAEILYTHFGAESLDVKNGALYTGLNDGRIIKIKDGNVDTVFRSGGINCDKKVEGCGKPNGVRFDHEGNLVVADLVKGVYKVNVETGDMTSIFPINQPVNAVTNYAHSSRSGDIYFSDCSNKWSGPSLFNEFMEVAPNGRVLRYNSAKKTTETLIDKLYLPNGVQLSPDEDFLLIAQSTKYNILKYHLKGAKKGQVEVFVDNLPGVPDNIHRTDRGTYWVALVGTRYFGHSSLPETLGSYTVIRKMIGRSMHGIDTALHWVNKNVQLQFLYRLGEKYQTTKKNLLLGPHHGIVFEIDGNGKVLRSLQSPTGHIHYPTHALEYDNNLYIASVLDNYIAKYNLKK